LPSVNNDCINWYSHTSCSTSDDGSRINNGAGSIGRRVDPTIRTASNGNDDTDDANVSIHADDAACVNAVAVDTATGE
jgi:hypothetical protein